MGSKCRRNERQHAKDELIQGLMLATKVNFSATILQNHNVFFRIAVGVHRDRAAGAGIFLVAARASRIALGLTAGASMALATRFMES